MSNKKPKLRFKGLTEDWEQRKAVDIADYSKGNGYSKSDLKEAGTPIILYGRLYTKYQFAIDEVDTFAIPKDGSVYSQGNEVIIPASGETAEDIARASAVEKSGVLLGGDLNILRPFNFINPLFLAITISNGKPQKELAKKAQGKSVVHIHNSDIQEVSVSFPTKAEQDRIVTGFRNLDNLITLHQRKYDKLVALKKSLLEKMFPEKKQNIPALRFKGNEKDWESKPLGKMGDTYTGLSGKTKDDFGHGKAQFVTYLNVFKNPIADANGVDFVEIDATQNVVKSGDVFFTTSSETPEEVGMSSVWLEDKQNTYLNSFCFGYRLFSSEKIDPLYLAYLLRSPGIRKEFQFLAQGISRYNISKTKVMDIVISLPEDYEEQVKIGKLFFNLDKLIELTQKKYEKLENLKKAMLNKMFV